MEQQIILSGLDVLFVCLVAGSTRYTHYEAVYKQQATCW